MAAKESKKRPNEEYTKQVKATIIATSSSGKQKNQKKKTNLIDYFFFCEIVHTSVLLYEGELPHFSG